MATRPIFVPLSATVGTRDVLVEFDWHPGMAPSQKRKSVASLHKAAKSVGISPVLEISSKSESEIGVALSAFNLSVRTKVSQIAFTVETAFQGSKVFERGGPYRDLIGMDSMGAKKDLRLKESGNLIGFEFFGRIFPAIPRTYFYDWLYVNALTQNDDLANAAVRFNGFSDIEFNPAKSINCQARSAALFVSLTNTAMLQRALESPAAFLDVVRSHYDSAVHAVQSTFI